ncbi:MAG: choice-of-anchor Q domain-containing protein, partial [Rhodanobacteraceae bacterium]
DYVTISNNTAASSNGALDVENDGTISISNSVVAGNAGSDCRDAATGTGLTDAGGNFFGDTSCNGSADGNAMLAPLAMTAGLTPTMTPLPGSLVIDAAACDAGVPTDQRGLTRPQGAGCDIGAVEVEASLFADGFDGN